MESKEFRAREIPMRREVNADIDDVPVVARSPSFQQPIEEAVEQTKMALEQRKVRRG